MAIEITKVFTWCAKLTPNSSCDRIRIGSPRVAAVSLMIVVLLGAVILAAPDALLAQVAARPNIVVIMTDDQRLDDMRVMPKTRALIGDAGTTFVNHHVALPTCCPSRATFLTGQYPHNHGVFSNAPPSGGFHKLNNNNTLPMWLQSAGYFTSHIGKYLNGYGASDAIPPGWNDWQSMYTGGGMYGYKINDNGVEVSYGTVAAHHNTDVIAGRAVQTIAEAAQRGQPFFISIMPKAVHDEPDIDGFPNPRPPARYLHSFDNTPLPRPPSFNEADVSDKPRAIRALSSIPAAGVNEITQRYRSRLSGLLGIDDLVQSVITKLSELALLDNTVVIFTSDNGWFQGEHRIRKGKGRHYEEATHVPLMIRGGGFPAGVIRHQFVSNIDLAPTIISLAQASARRVMDGQSLLPLATNPSASSNRSLLIELLGLKAVRNKSFLYVQHSTGERELYDMRPGTANYDPYQLNSRHASSAYAQIRSQLATKLNQLRTCSGTTCAVQ
jgi:arylsulfatase A-like enzyme